MGFRENDEKTKEMLYLSSEERRKNKNKRRTVLLVAFLFVATNAVSLYAGSSMAVAAGGKTAVSSQNYSDVAKFKKLFDVKEDINKYYFGDIDDDALVEGAIKGMTSALNDPYTVFMNAKEYQDFNTQTEGTYVGLGLQVGVKNDKITVIAPFEGSPAEKAGVITGDNIIKVGDKEVTGKDLELAVSMMKGKEGEPVTITLFRENKGAFDLTIKRAQINLVTVKGEMLEGNIGYIQLSMFDEHTGKEFNNKLKELKDKGAKGLVLDLRGNPGGLLTSCIEVSSNFVEKGKVLVSTKDKNGNEKPYKSEGGIAVGMPLVVLTDEGTASASEILSGVVRDYQLGTLVGTTTFGKGVVQTLLDTKDGTALKVTISKYFTPNGENIHKIGIKPNVEVKYPTELKDKPYSRETDPQYSKALEIIKEKLK